MGRECQRLPGYYAGLSEDDIRQQIDELYPDGYYDYKLGQSYEDKYYEEWSRR